MKLLKEQLALVVLFSVLLAGINSCQKPLDDLVRTLGNAVATLAQVSGNPQLAAKLRADTDSAVALIRVWKEGQSTAEVIRALNVLIDDLQTFPVPDRFRPLITFTLGTLASIIDLLNSRGGGHDRPHTPVRITSPPHTSKEFRETWDAIRNGSPNMHDAPVI